MEIKRQQDGTIDVASTLNNLNTGDGSLLQAVLGKEVNTNTTSDQSTASTSNQAATGTSSSTGSQGTVTAGTSNQAVTGTTGNTSAGSQSSAGTNNQATTGSTSGTGTSQQSTTGAQSATGTSSQSTTGSTSGTGTSQQAQTGASSTVTGTVQQGQQAQHAAGQQSTTGSTTTGGTTATTGTVTNNGSSTQQGTVDQRSTANVDALNEVYKRQASGITPDMLAAIFQQGAKAAPGLAIAQAGAIGARGVGNSPLAQSLNMMNVELTSKAADLNRQMLGDAGNTAAQIAAATKGTSTTTDMTTSSLSTQVQDLLAKTDSTSIVNQLMQTLNDTVSNNSSTGSSTANQVSSGTTVGSTSNQTGSSGTTVGSTSNNAVNTGTTAGATSNGTVSSGTTTGSNMGTQTTHQSGTGTSTQNTAQSNAGTSQVNTAQNGTTGQTTTGATTQNVHAAEAKHQQLTVNTSTVKSLAGLAAAGVGINELFKAATGKGFVGTVKDLYGALKGLGLSSINVADAPGIDFSQTIAAGSLGDGTSYIDPIFSGSGDGLGSIISNLFGGG